MMLPVIINANTLAHHEDTNTRAHHEDTQTAQAHGNTQAHHAAPRARHTCAQTVTSAPVCVGVWHIAALEPEIQNKRGTMHTFRDLFRP